MVFDERTNKDLSPTLAWLLNRNFVDSKNSAALVVNIRKHFIRVLLTVHLSRGNWSKYHIE